MKNFKHTTVIDGIRIVLIPAKKLTTETLCICIKENGLLMDALHLGTLSRPCSKGDLKHDPGGVAEYFAPYHAYVLSDKTIKVGHWVYRSDTNQVFQTDLVTDAYINMPNEMGGEGVRKKLCTKIGKTTDRNLVLDTLQSHKRVPKLNDDFISKLCYEYNKQNAEFYKKLSLSNK